MTSPANNRQVTAPNAEGYIVKSQEIIKKNDKEWVKITSEKKLNIPETIAFGILAFLATVTLIPLLVSSERIIRLWKTAITQTDQKITLASKQTFPQSCQNLSEAKTYHSNTIPTIPLGAQIRSLPPLGLQDTCVITPNGIRSAHQDYHLFHDKDILKTEPIIRRQKIGPDVYANYTRHGKAIIKQQGKRGCTAATAAMLIMDRGGKPNINMLQSRNIGTDDNQQQDIEDAGFKPLMNSVKGPDLKKLRSLLLKNGSAVVSVNKGAGAHVIVVDAVSRDLCEIRLRDPYHGWEITVSQAAFLEEWNGGKAIQIANH